MKTTNKALSGTGVTCPSQGKISYLKISWLLHLRLFPGVCTSGQEMLSSNNSFLPKFEEFVTKEVT
ncbi:hypothetical protein pdam_00014670 [Pocillopora damicornis]|uniref:Uncharacterized protein n=1 Tax=Pocillopora damicornis TaxID=46731 RepID=A0A3M6TLS9_POCDA|nr:hypothetical protein pdam_00014670 [Pocillopora damicornis]